MKATPRSTVLIVDDDFTLRGALQSALVAMGCRVLTAAEADTAYALLAGGPVDAVLLDVRLPTMSGLALYLAIVHRWPQLEGRIAVMTGDADAPDVRPWLELQRCTVFRKPFRVEQLAAWLDAALLVRERKAVAR
ncbi:MAG TPA: response regulator [Gemmatimonadales bacterium]|nr:response regulator [Gemmatimonadales bacterium]